jgi:ABC-type multidrug transport system permease subunit
MDCWPCFLVAIAVGLCILWIVLDWWKKGSP